MMPAFFSFTDYYMFNKQMLKKKISTSTCNTLFGMKRMDDVKDKGRKTSAA